MKCPECGSDHMSRVYYCYEKGDTVRRYRECTVCGVRYVTTEALVKVLK